ncbi:hypothetical protein Pla110_17500 [Polystyrenella longa]|uniref:Uncharacterized protein n=1 Tax=Polystyrenella longa TaxID=2528007 RepID=A0A518CLC4_9PLAN|nr:hypothetical protein [Polystyrenella longa]QDU80028.1 hypothetical protein Pla110_17500 [Polystyrenella longa]
MKSIYKRITAMSLAVPMMFAAPDILTGCDDDKEIMEIETPDSETTIEQDPDTGEIDIETDN